MKKMYFLTVALIIVITAGFLIFSQDTDTVNRNFLSSFGIIVSDEPVSFENFVIPEEFDSIYEDYNMLQIECGLDLVHYKGNRAVRYTYEVLNFPESLENKIFANVICVNHRPVAGDIMCPAVDGFLKPLNFLESISSQ